MADVFAKYAEKHLLSKRSMRLECVTVRIRGSRLRTSPRLLHMDDDRGSASTRRGLEKDKAGVPRSPFSEAEVFEFPEGIARGVRERGARKRFCSFAAMGRLQASSPSSTGWATSFINVLKVIKMLGLDNRFPMTSKA